MADHVMIAGLLAKTALFRQLNDAQRQAVAKEMRPVPLGAGELLFGRGDKGSDIYLVIEGRVRLSMLSPEGRELSFVQAGPGSLFGEIAALDGKGRTADATAVGKVQAMVLSGAVFHRLLATNPDMAKGAIAFLCERIRESAEQLESIALLSVEMRLARFLLSTARQKRGNGTAAKVTIDIGMSQSDLALFLGASRPKVNVALSGLEDVGAIERDGHRIVVNIAELEPMAGTE